MFRKFLIFLIFHFLTFLDVFVKVAMESFLLITTFKSLIKLTIEMYNFLSSIMSNKKKYSRGIYTKAHKPKKLP